MGEEPYVDGLFYVQELDESSRHIVMIRIDDVSGELVLDNLSLSEAVLMADRYNKLADAYYGGE